MSVLEQELLTSAGERNPTSVEAVHLRTPPPRALICDGVGTHIDEIADAASPTLDQAGRSVLLQLCAKLKNKAGSSLDLAPASSIDNSVTIDTDLEP